MFLLLKDEGSEFNNKIIKSFLKKHNSELYLLGGMIFFSFGYI